MLSPPRVVMRSGSLPDLCFLVSPSLLPVSPPSLARGPPARIALLAPPSSLASVIRCIARCVRRCSLTQMVGCRSDRER